MNIYTWPANLIDEANLLDFSCTLSPNKLKDVVINYVIPDTSIPEKEKKNEIKRCLYLDNGRVYQADLKNEKSMKNLEKKVYRPLAKFRVLSLYCGYCTYGVITASNHAYIWGKSEKGQCGSVESFVAKPQKIRLKSADIVCQHGFREPGRQLPVVSLSFSKTLCLAICSDGSLWNWGSISVNEQPQSKPKRVDIFYGRRVLSIACGEEHYLALVASENEFDINRRLKYLSASPSEFSLLNYVDSCAKCRELKAKPNRNVDEEENFHIWESKTNASTEVNFDDSTDLCPLGKQLRLSSDSVLPPDDDLDDNYDNSLTIEDSSPKKKKRNLPKYSYARSVSLAGDVLYRSSPIDSSSRQRYQKRGNTSIILETKETKNIEKRFSFTSFEFNVVDSSSENEDGRQRKLVSNETEINDEDNNFSVSSVSTITSGNLFLPKIVKQKNSKRNLTSQTSTEVWSWGDNSRGQLGLDDFICRSEPTRINKLRGAHIMRVEAGRFHSLALSSIGEAWTWGSNLYGQSQQANNFLQSSPVKIGSQFCILDCAAGPDFTVLLVNRLDYNSDIYYCGRDYHRMTSHDSGDIGFDIGLRFSSINEYHWPVCLNSSNDLIIASTRDSQRSPLLQYILELLCSEIKFAYKLKKLHTFSIKSCQQRQGKPMTLLKDYAQTLEQVFIIVLQRLFIMKTQLREINHPLVASKFFDILLSPTYESTLKRLHSIFCQMLAFNVFSGKFSFTESLEMENLLDSLDEFNELKSLRQYRQLRKLYSIPFSRLNEYCKLTQVIIQNIKELDIEENNRLINFVKNVKVLDQLLLNHFYLAENTSQFWPTCITGRASLIPLKMENRFLIKAFTKLNGMLNILWNDTPVHWQQVLVFSDSIAFILKHSHKLLKLPLVWIEPLDSDSNFYVQLVTPESRWTVKLADGITKNDFVQCCNRALTMHQNGHYTKWIPGGASPPLHRYASYKFSSEHPLYGDAFYDGCWALGKVHGRGEMTWSNGQFFRGKFKNGLMHGLGELRINEITGGNTSKRGHWKDGNLTGLAVIDYANGSKYEGYLKNGLKSGHGVLKQRNYLYVGAWNNDTRHGYGVLDRGKEKYLGMWETDVECGLGTLVTLEGDSCEGTFDKGVFVKGIMVTAKGTKYEGIFKGFGILNGKGSIHYPNGDTISGFLQGSVMEHIKITNGIDKSSEALTPITNTGLLCWAITDDQPASLIKGKWADMFGHVDENLGIDRHALSMDGVRIWGNVVATLERLKAFFNDKKFSHNTVIETIPNWDCAELDDAYLQMVFEYCSKAFALPIHPLGRLLNGLADVFNACYSGVGAHPKLLPQAVAEIFSMIKEFINL